MKKRTVEYTEEPAAKGWKFNPDAKPLSASALKKLGIPSPQPGADFEKTVSHGVVSLSPASHGGKRNGAGRKPTGNVRIQLSVPAEIRKKLGKLAEKDAVTLSEAFSRVMRAV
ncbi:MAG: hypothetical protein QM680_10540 [Luteolibacter sp.]